MTTTIIFPHVDSEVIKEIDLGMIGFVNFTLSVGHYITEQGGLSDYDKYLVADVKRLEVTAVDGDKKSSLIDYYNNILNKMLKTGKINAEISERIEV
jgi:hypothetical protein